MANQGAAARAREALPEIVNRAAYGGERTIVSRRGKPLAAVREVQEQGTISSRKAKKLLRLQASSSCSHV